MNLLKLSYLPIVEPLFWVKLTFKKDLWKRKWALEFRNKEMGANSNKRKLLTFRWLRVGIDTILDFWPNRIDPNQTELNQSVFILNWISSVLLNSKKRNLLMFWWLQAGWTHFSIFYQIGLTRIKPNQINRFLFLFESVRFY